MEISAVETPRRSSDSSTEFEFWMVGNHPQPLLLTADELFVDGVLLPLHSLTLPRPGLEPEPDPAPDPPPADDSAPASICSAAAPPSGSKRWKDIFRVGEKKAEEKERKKERNNSSGGAAELNININIWPFSRSRSAGNGGAGVRTRAVTGRMASSAPCSRSNSRGESAKTASASTTRRCAASPGRAGLSGGVHLGRNSPVWHVRRTAKSGETAGRGPDMTKASGGGRKGSSGRVLSLNVNTCIGYRSQVSCRGDENDEITRGARSRETRDGSLFNLRTLFTKKVY